jgi:hypothetical protein
MWNGVFIAGLPQELIDKRYPWQEIIIFSSSPILGRIFLEIYHYRFKRQTSGDFGVDGYWNWGL